MTGTSSFFPPRFNACFMNNLSVFKHVLGSCHQLKVFRPVIELDVVYVVNHFVGRKFPSKNLLHNMPVLENIRAVHFYALVARWTDIAALVHWVLTARLKPYLCCAGIPNRHFMLPENIQDRAKVATKSFPQNNTAVSVTFLVKLAYFLLNFIAKLAVPFALFHRAIITRDCYSRIANALYLIMHGRLIAEGKEYTL